MRSPSCGEPGDLELVRADHEVDVEAADVEAVALLLGGRERIRGAERDVARGVLVEQGVVEHGAELPDPALAIDERELAEPGRALVQLDLGTQGLGPFVGVDLDRLARPRSAPRDRGRSSRPSARAAWST